MDIVKSGKSAGALKFKNMPKRGDLKERNEDLYHKLDGLTFANPLWETKNLGVFKTGADQLVEVRERGGSAH